MEYFHNFFFQSSPRYVHNTIHGLCALKKPPLNSQHIKAILLFMGVEFSLIKNPELGKFFSLLSKDINFFLACKADQQCFRLVNWTITFFFLMPKRWQTLVPLLLIFASIALNMFTTVFSRFSALTTLMILETFFRWLC